MGSKDKWEIEGVRGEVTNDTVFVRNKETGQRESVCVTSTSDKEVREKEVGDKISKGQFDKK
jgi:hypothetical protein